MAAMCTTPTAALEVTTAFCPCKTGTNAKLLQVNFPCDYLASVDIPEQRILSNIINDHTEDVIKYRHIINMIKIMLLKFQTVLTGLVTMLIHKTTLSVTLSAPDWTQLTQQEPVYLIRRLIIKHVLPIGKYATVFQAKMYAILRCATQLYDSTVRSITICLNCQAALSSISAAK